MTATLSFDLHNSVIRKFLQQFSMYVENCKPVTFQTTLFNQEREPVDTKPVQGKLFGVQVTPNGTPQLLVLFYDREHVCEMVRKKGGKYFFQACLRMENDVCNACSH